MAKFNATGVYAFVAWIASMVVFVVFLLWAFSPRSLLHQIGITYYPSRYYAIALPAYIIMLIFVVNIGYIGINMMMTHEPDDMFTVKDGQTRSSPNVFLKCSALGGNTLPCNCARHLFSRFLHHLLLLLSFFPLISELYPTYHCPEFVFNFMLYLPLAMIRNGI